MFGGSLSAYYEYLGNSGTGTFAQSGGTNNGALYLGYNSGSSSIYNLSGSGMLTAMYYQYVGYSGNGTFTQSGGTNSGPSYTNVGNMLYLGYNVGSSGSYNLSGSGVLSTLCEFVGSSGNGTFIQSGGANGAGTTFMLATTRGPAAGMASAAQDCSPATMSTWATPAAALLPSRAGQQSCRLWHAFRRLQLRGPAAATTSVARECYQRTAST